jgi:hypothetical protein
LTEAAATFERDARGLQPMQALPSVLVVVVVVDDDVVVVVEYLSTNLSTKQIFYPEPLDESRAERAVSAAFRRPVRSTLLSSFLRVRR